MYIRNAKRPPSRLHDYSISAKPRVDKSMKFNKDLELELREGCLCSFSLLYDKRKLVIYPNPIHTAPPKKNHTSSYHHENVSNGKILFHRRKSPQAHVTSALNFKQHTCRSRLDQSQQTIQTPVSHNEHLRIPRKISLSSSSEIVPTN